MSTPPFIAMPDGVALFEPPTAPAPVLLAEPRAGVTSGADGVDEVPPALRNVLLVPGFTGSKEDFIAIIAPLAARGWRVAAVDLPGQGGFPGLGPRGSHTLGSLAEFVSTVADWFSPDAPVHLVGHSMGGLVTRDVVLTRADRLASWVPICSGPAAIPAQSFDSLRGLQLAVVSAPMEVVWTHKEALDRAGGWDPPSEEVAAFCARRFIANDPAALADFAEILMTATDRVDEVSAALAGAGIAAAVVTGELDDAWPITEQERMASRLGVEWRVIPAVGHNPSTEDPGATVAVLDAILRDAARR